MPRLTHGGVPTEQGLSTPMAQILSDLLPEVLRRDDV